MATTSETDRSVAARAKSRPVSMQGEDEPPAQESKPTKDEDLNLEEGFNFEQAREQTLLDAYASGDAGALEELLLANEDRVYATCLRMCGDPDHARDLTQDTFMRVIQGLEQFGGKSKLSTWITRIAINVCLSDRRRQTVRQTLSLDSSPKGSGGRGAGEEVSGASLASLLADSKEPGPVRRVESDEQRQLLALAISRLDPQRRVILILRDGQELDYTEIAEVLGVPTGTVKSRLFRARVALRNELEKLAGDQREGGQATTSP